MMENSVSTYVLQDERESERDFAFYYGHVFFFKSIFIRFDMSTCMYSYDTCENKCLVIGN